MYICKVTILKKIYNFYIFSNMHVALACFSLTKLSLLYWHKDTNSVPFFVFLTTVVSYNYIRLLRQKSIKSWLSDWIHVNRSLLKLLSAFALLGASVLAYNLTLRAIAVLLPFGLLTFLYVLPGVLLQRLNLRNLPMLKIFIIALSWAGVTVLFPLAQEGDFNSTVFWLFTQRFLFVVALTIPFDIRDLPFDSEKMVTLPQLIGITKTKYLGVLFLILALLIDVFVLKTTHFFAMALTNIILAILIYKSATKQGKYYSAFWVEGIPILWFILYCIV